MANTPRFWNPQKLDYSNCPRMRNLIASKPSWRRRPDYFPNGQDWLEDHEARLAVAEKHGVLPLYFTRLHSCTVQNRTSYFAELAVVRFLEESVGMKVTKFQEGNAEIEFELSILGQQVLTEVRCPGWQGQFAEGWRVEQNRRKNLDPSHPLRPTKAQRHRLHHPYQFLQSDGVRTLSGADVLRQQIDETEPKFKGVWPRFVIICDQLWTGRTGVALLAAEALLADRDQDSSGRPVKRGLFRQKDPHWLDCVGFLRTEHANSYDFRMIVNDRSPRADLFRQGFTAWYRPTFPEEGWRS